ncbi:YceI family protein [Pseudozobellia thermophila]|uniref:YceI-like domain-containing protein n=1 Tax=Pseudozobellia thermophila TaxID=192903 RepID=A0A1M6D9V6_9FLAO|nr:YceI family protein [Pseudozobellia thermophila]SHI69951.1 YceI-like domain-containing protein [Pseudozobellia thermophila]
MKYIITLVLVAYGFVLSAQDLYTLSDESTLTIDGTSTVHDWTVAAQKMVGELQLSDATIKEINFEVDVAEIKSERGATMDNKMHKALKKDEYPKITFVLTGLKDESTVVGNLTIAGKRNVAEIPVALNSSGNVVELSGEYKLVLQDFGIEPPTAMFGQIVVGDEVTVKFNLKFAK